MILVVDTSIIIKWFISEADCVQAREFLGAEYNLATPEFALAEMANVLWRRQRIGDIVPDHVDETLIRLLMFFKHLVPISDLLTDGLRLARELRHSVYDCLFLAVAEILTEERLVTADARFLGKVTGSRYDTLLLPLASRSPTEK